MRHPGAVVCAAPSAAGRQIVAGAGREGKHGRDQRKAEEEKQDGAEKTPHTAIVASFGDGCVSEMFAAENCVGFSPWISPGISSGISPGLELN